MGVRTYDCKVEDSKGRVIAEAWCRAYNVADPANPVLVETQYSGGDGIAHFVALPDNAAVDVQAIYGNLSIWFRNVFSVGGDDIETANALQHTQNTDDYAAGLLVVTEYPGSPVEGEMVVL